MLRSIEAIVDSEGRIQPIESLNVPQGTHAIVTFLVASETEALNENAMLSESSLADWNRPEEDEAWAFLQEGR